ncbi:nitrate reductase [Sphingomonas oleivorans]|uniref:Nitrate reductase n=1 Tax=Sphingomonas oleivorans TaxID=1735121 RepID=A0A2T5FV74_9SPHN|nr:NCS1 family nucleobase:cation symporter-1 [Sphingomonas oleivorans]PTQ08859.1 nitrate reductase [Sphingomonas oleivorans]
MPGDPALSNADLVPTTAAQRNWRWYHYAALWIGMVVSVPSYMVASGLIEQGMSAIQAVLTVLLGNLIVLVPMLLIGHAGARYGIPYAVLARASFGTAGARIPALARALVACGWYGIQTWIGGSTILTLLGAAAGRDLAGVPLPLFGIGPGQLAAFLAFWLIQLVFVAKGLPAIRRLETWTAPAKILVCLALVWWALDRAGGIGPIFHAPSAFVAGGAQEGRFWQVFWPALTAMAAFWGTLALNIPDFTRFAHSQRDQMVGQAIGLPVPMGLLALVGVVTTSATVVIYGKAIWDPVAVAGNMASIGMLIGLLIITIDTVSCNIAANLVGAAYDFSLLWPARISYRRGGLITACIGVAIMPWKLLASTNGYIFTWLVGYGALLGPITGILIADYWLVRRTRLVVEELYIQGGRYSYRNGWNGAALAAFLLGLAPNLPGFLHTAAPATFAGISSFWTEIYAYAWFVGVFVAAGSYRLLMTASPEPISREQRA